MLLENSVERYDVESGLYYCNSRYYDSNLCTWLSPDSIDYLDPESFNGLNLYIYCNYNPITYIDPSGHEAITAALLAAAYYVLIGLLALYTVAYIGYVESETHIIQNSLTWLGNTILDFGEYAVSTMKELFYSETISVPSQELNDEYYNIISNNPDPHGRAGQKKQGRELKNKARERFTRKVKYRRGRKPLKKHTPGRGHNKHFHLYLWRYLRDEKKQWGNLDRLRV